MTPTTATIAFKVVQGIKSFRPATSAALQRIRYRLGETTQQGSDHGPFALFETFDQAGRFGDRNCDDFRILECEFAPSNEKCLWKKNPPDFVRSRFGRGHGYYAQSNGTTERPLGNCPEGTILASSVTPIRLCD